MKTNQKGFTLAELLIVMAIIVVLAAVAVPTFGKQLETSRETSDMELVRNIYTDVLSLAIKDGADGKLDGKIGGGSIAATATGITTDEDTTSNDGKDGDQKYTVTVGTWLTGAKFAQNGTSATVSANAGAWTYVSDKLMGLTVPPVNVKTASLTFVFQFNTEGDVVPKASKFPSDEATASHLFAPA